MPANSGGRLREPGPMGLNLILAHFSNMKGRFKTINAYLSKSRPAAALALTVAVLVSACAILGGEAIRYHAFDYPTPIRDVTSAIPDTLMVYRFLLADTVDVRELVITEAKGEGRLEQRHRWEQNPADMVTDLIIRDMKSSGLFDKTVDQSSSEQYRYALECTLLKLQGRKSGGKAWADLEAEVTLLDFESGWGAKAAIMKKHYKIEAPGLNDSPESIVAAINQAVRILSNRIRADARSALEKRETPNGQDSAPKSSPTVRLGGSLNPSFHNYGHVFVLRPALFG